jgi:hypothetical protein
MRLPLNLALVVLDLDHEMTPLTADVLGSFRPISRQP